MRVLHLIHQFYPEYVGGSEHYTRSVAAALNTSGHAAAVFHRAAGRGQGWLRSEAAGVPVYRAWHGSMSPARRFAAGFGDGALARAWAEAVADFRPDVVHWQHSMGLPTALAGQLTAAGIPYVVTLLDYYTFCAAANRLTVYSGRPCAGPRGYLNCTRCAVARAGTPAAWATAPALTPALVWRSQRLRGVLAGAAAVLGPSRSVIEWYSEHGFPAERMELLPLPVDKPPAPMAPHMPVNRPLRFLYIGGLAYNKGVHTLLQAFAPLAGQAELWIGGDEGFDPAYSRQLRAQAVEGVRFLGRLERPEVWARLAECDVVLTPSLFYETYCLVAHEAQAACRPVLAARRGALMEAVEHGRNGLLLEPEDAAAWREAMARFVAEPELATEMGRRARRPMMLDEHMARLEQVYAAACAARGAA